MSHDNCIFCNIINGKIPSSTVYEDDDFKVIMDIFPASKGHAIAIPKKHAANIFELEESIAAKALVVVKKVAKALQDELQCEGLNLLQNNGEIAGQTVFHFHIHLIPRYRQDKIRITWENGSYGEGEAAVLAEAIKKRI